VKWSFFGFFAVRFKQFALNSCGTVFSVVKWLFDRAASSVVTVVNWYLPHSAVAPSCSLLPAPALGPVLVGWVRFGSSGGCRDPAFAPPCILHIHFRSFCRFRSAGWRGASVGSVAVICRKILHKHFVGCAVLVVIRCWGYC
jgi:hypothetical protein